MTAANDPLPDDLIDSAYDIMCAELDHWQIIGPQQDARTRVEFFSAVRRLDQQGFAPVSLREAGSAAQIEHKAFTERKYAIAYIQWRSLKAVLEAMQEPLSKLSA